MDKKIYLTKEGLAELKKEYDEIVNKKRPDILGRVSQARNMGDLAENAEYAAARDELTFIDGRIDELEVLLKQAVLLPRLAIRPRLSNPALVLPDHRIFAIRVSGPLSPRFLLEPHTEQG